MSLGVPGDAATAVLLGALTIHGFEPGPECFAANLELVNSIFSGVIVTQAVLLIVGLSLAGIFARLIRIDQKTMVPADSVPVHVRRLFGPPQPVRYAADAGLGAVGYLLEKARISLSPMLLGIVLGTLAEQNLRRSLITSGQIDHPAPTPPIGRSRPDGGCCGHRHVARLP